MNTEDVEGTESSRANAKGAAIWPPLLFLWMEQVLVVAAVISIVVIEVEEIE
jgi:hypothetical protein